MHFKYFHKLSIKVPKKLKTFPNREDNHCWKTTFCERQLQWKRTFSGRGPLLDPCMLPTPLCGIFWCFHIFAYIFFNIFLHFSSIPYIFKIVFKCLKSSSFIYISRFVRLFVWRIFFGQNIVGSNLNLKKNRFCHLKLETSLYCVYLTPLPPTNCNILCGQICGRILEDTHTATGGKNTVFSHFFMCSLLCKILNILHLRICPTTLQSTEF